MSIMIKKETKGSHIFVDKGKMPKLGKEISKMLRKGDIIYIYGQLGAGKTTITRAILQGLGFTGNVKSPTYTLVESYRVKGVTLQHFDLYRLSNPEELEWIGIRDYFSDDTISLIEWPEKGGDSLPSPTKEINIRYATNGRLILLKL